MTTITPFAPSTGSTFQFQPTLDGVTYTAIVNWNLFAKRFWFNLYTLQGARVLAIPLVGSPVGYDVDIVDGYFSTSAVVYRAPSAQFEVTP